MAFDSEIAPSARARRAQPLEASERAAQQFKRFLVRGTPPSAPFKDVKESPH